MGYLPRWIWQEAELRDKLAREDDLFGKRKREPLRLDSARRGCRHLFPKTTRAPRSKEGMGGVSILRWRGCGVVVEGSSGAEGGGAATLTEQFGASAEQLACDSLYVGGLYRREKTLVL